MELISELVFVHGKKAPTTMRRCRTVINILSKDNTIFYREYHNYSIWEYIIAIIISRALV